MSPSASVPAPGTPAPTAAAVLAIASDLTVLGDTASYSPDGTWFAFTARDSGATGGSDIYVWRLGRTMATPVTADHRSVFAGWDDDRIVGSRAAPTANGDSPRPSSEASPSDKTTDDDAVSFLLDPATLAATPLAVPAWRPVVDPTGGYALYWQGTVVPDDAGGWTTSTGRLVLAPWDAMTATSQTVAPIELPADVASAAGVGWQARWDETGSHLAIWTADRSDPTLGHLDFLTVDRKTGLADPTGPSLRDRPALAGFALENGHLAWATPPGQDGQGSTLQVYAWSGPHAGQISSQAADGSDPVIVVQH